MKAWKEYQNQLPYPNRIDFSTAYWYRAGKVVAQREASGGEIVFHDNVSTTDLGGCLSETVLRKDEFTAKMDVYRAETARLTEMFRQDLFEDLGIEHNPMRDKLFNKAWEDGHANGFSEVYTCACNLVELIELPARSVLITPETITITSVGVGIFQATHTLAGQLQEMLR